MRYTTIQSEPSLWTVGQYTPTGEWIPRSDHDTREEAYEWERYYNGDGPDPEDLPDAYRVLEHLTSARLELERLEKSAITEERRKGLREDAQGLKDAEKIINQYIKTI